MKKKPQIIILSGYGLNCEEETKFAFELSGGVGDIVHINDLIEKPSILSKYDIMAFPGGFSFGDDTGSGKAYANKLKNHLGPVIKKFLTRNTLVIGICNGFQILTQLELLPGALTFNKDARYIDRWVDVKAIGDSPWLKGISEISLPIAHGEGNYVISQKEMAELKKNKQIAFTYIDGPMSAFQHMSANPNGAMDDVAGVLGYEGRVLGMMPHPERAITITQFPNWYIKKEEALRKGIPLNEEGDGLLIFQNAVRYFHE